MATVFLAEEIDTGRQVAVKMMQTRLQGTARQRFTREFSTIASVKHPHCLEVFEYGESDQGPFFAMELFAGEPATALIGQPLAIALKALYQVAEAVDYVHGRRIIHRDIKPGNILVRSKPDSSGFDVRLTDFGLAKFANTSSSLSGEGNFLGTIAYCAPEQIMRDELDHRCDIYSFGMVCYEVLAGRHAFSEVGSNVQALVAKHLRDLPLQVRSYNRNVSPEIEAAVMQMLAKDAGSRPQSTFAFRQAIAAFLDWKAGQERPEPQKDGRGLVGTFVSREQEKQLLDMLLSENLLVDGNSSRAWAQEQPTFLALLTGEAGLGKSSLLRQAARSALANGSNVYEGRCFEGNLAPFQPFVEIIRQLLVEQEQLRLRRSSSQDGLPAQTTAVQSGDPGVRVDRIVQNYTPELLRIAPELKDLLRGEAFTHAERVQQSDYVLRAIARFFVEVSKVQRMCLLLEDVHWADNSSLSLLVHLGAALRTARREAAEQEEPPPRLFVCATTRPEGTTRRFLRHWAI
jgi:serine/threonine-protein kinase